MEIACSVVKDVSVLRRMLFATANLPQDLPGYWEVIAKFACDGSSTSIDAATVKLLMENLQVLNDQAFSTDLKLTKELLNADSKSSVQPLGIVLLSDKSSCRLCGGTLLLRRDRPSKVTLYTEHLGTVPATHYHKFCHNQRRGCKLIQFYGYSKEGDKSGVQYDAEWKTHKYFLSSQETGFELCMLQKFDVELLIGQVSYKQKADIYNIYNGYDNTMKKHTKQVSKPTQVSEDTEPVLELCSTLSKRQTLDRRRIEAAHLKYAVLQTVARYPDQFCASELVFYPDVEQTLQITTPRFYSAFQARYSAHSCTFPGCGKVLVLDGNMKNRRDVCYAKDAGYLEFEGLSGSIKSGCQATPAYKSRYCDRHKHFACDTQQLTATEDEDGDDLDAPIGPLVRSKQKQKKPGESIVELILAKKQTRQQTYYKVMWLGRPECETTWEPATALSPSLVADYEAGILTETSTEYDATYGHTSTTLVVKNALQEPALKKSKRERFCQDDENGAFRNDTLTELTCRTEKDRGVRLNHRTAGILAGVWPCGVITLLSELFNAESKSQVYGHLHCFLQNAPKTTENLRYICYDDGCHLSKYATNPCRRDLTPTTQAISQMSIVIDKMHMAGHVDAWCKENCDPHKFRDLDKVDTEACEQIFSWLSRYGKMTRKMNRHTYMFFIIYLCDLHNERELQKLQRAKYLC